VKLDRDALGRVAYYSNPDPRKRLWEELDEDEREDCRRIAEAVARAVLEDNELHRIWVVVGAARDAVVADDVATGCQRLKFALLELDKALKQDGSVRP
jgi:hypothetical protein